jgi:hypothetical protein
MTTRVKVLAGLLLLVTAFAAGWMTRPPVVKVETKIQTIEKVITKTIVKTVTDPKTGEVTETTETITDSTTTTDQNTTTKPPTAVAAGTVARRNWSVGVSWQPDWKDRTWVPAQGEVGYRVFADAWVVGAYNWKENAALLGVRYEF